MEPIDPTPEEIADACQRIREGWDEREHKKRAGENRGGGWTPPVVSGPECEELEG